MPSIVEDDLERWPRERRAELLLRLGGDVVVIAVEQPKEVRMEGPIAGQIFAQNEGFEEPGGVRQVPFCWAGLRTALHHHVFGCEGVTQCEGLASRRGKVDEDSGRA